MVEDVVVGRRAPEFVLPDETGKQISLKSFRGKQVILYFYPKDDTSGCTKEACAFRDEIRPITKTKAVVLGLSLDGKESHQKFIAKYELPFSLLTDQEATVSKAYGVYKKKSMYGRTYWGIARSTFVVDEQGYLKALFRNVTVEGHVDVVLAALQGKKVRGRRGGKKAT